MIRTYGVTAVGLQPYDGFVTAEHLAQASWIDLFMPTEDEEQHVEGVLGVELPTREEMRALEDSHRLYEEGGALYLTATVMVNSEAEYPRSDNLTFVLTRQCLATVRYAAPRAIQIFGEFFNAPVLERAEPFDEILNRLWCGTFGELVNLGRQFRWQRVCRRSLAAGLTRLRRGVTG